MSTHRIGTTAELENDLIATGALLRDVTVVIASGSARRGSGAPRAGDRSARAHGSGIVWSDDTIITNAHVAIADDLTVTFADGRRVAARVSLRDPRWDLAALRVDVADTNSAPRRVATIGEPSALRTGHVVVANGHPLGVEHALSLGVVHTVSSDPSNPYISADIRLAPGNSGGPLADARGHVVGVNSMIVGGLGVAISVNAVRRMLAAGAPKPSLGLQLRAVRVRVPARASTVSVAMLVLGVARNSAAARAGIMIGDVLLGHAGRPFRSAEDLSRLLHDAGAHASLRLDVGRAQRQFTVEVETGALGASPSGTRRRAA